MTITFVRHTSVGVGPGVCYGHSDVPVAETFTAEAKAVVDALGGRRFDAVHTSPSTRCVRLAEACGHPDAMRDPRLMEMDFGRWEMQRWDDIRDPRLQLWYDDWINTPATGGESFLDHRRRVHSFMADVAASGARSVLVFAHGGTIMHARLWNCPERVEDIFSLRPPYGGIAEIELN